MTPVKRTVLRSELRQQFRDLPKEIKAKTTWPQFRSYMRKLHQHQRQKGQNNYESV